MYITKLEIQILVSNLVVTYKNRLARFGFELIEMLIKKYSGGKIIVLYKKDSPIEDIMAIMNIYVAKINGMRKYKNKYV